MEIIIEAHSLSSICSFKEASLRIEPFSNRAGKLCKVKAKAKGKAKHCPWRVKQNPQILLYNTFIYIICNTSEFIERLCCLKNGCYQFRMPINLAAINNTLKGRSIRLKIEWTHIHIHIDSYALQLCILLIASNPIRCALSCEILNT